MSATAETHVAQRQILLVGPYGVLGTGVVDAVAENPQWGITTAARRPVPTYRAQAAPPHVSVDLMDREGTTKAFSSLDKVTDLVFAAYVEKPTMAETVEPNARMLKNTLDALAARNVPLQRIVLAGGAKSYGFSLGRSTLRRRKRSHVLLRRSTTTSKKTLWLNGPIKTVLAGRSCVPIWSWDQA
jgi:nucleoside-diphosphate-sugar epimerase